MGRFFHNTDGYEVRFERFLQHPIERVWRALTDPAIIRIWFTDVEMDFREGGRITIWFRDEQHTESPGEIIRIDPLHHFSFLWENELAVWELEAIADHETKLNFAYSRISREYAISVPAGWHIILDQLESVLDGHTEPYPFGDGNETPKQRELKALYKAKILEDYPELG